MLISHLEKEFLYIERVPLNLDCVGVQKESHFCHRIVLYNVVRMRVRIPASVR
jgi:hypothetical protein